MKNLSGKHACLPVFCWSGSANGAKFPISGANWRRGKTFRSVELKGQRSLLLHEEIGPFLNRVEYEYALLDGSAIGILQSNVSVNSDPDKHLEIGSRL